MSSYDFTVVARGSGDTPEETWCDVMGFTDNPGCTPDEYEEIEED
jgi:hypothetical protein